jgi:hypothetical protein
MTDTPATTPETPTPPAPAKSAAKKGAKFTNPYIWGTGRRKAYEITTEGREAFDTLLETDPEASETERAFQIRLAFLGRLPTQRRVQVLEGRRTKLTTHLKAAREILIDARTPSKNPDRYRLALMEHAMRSTEADIAWLDGLVAAERSVASS